MSLHFHVPLRGAFIDDPERPYVTIGSFLKVEEDYDGGGWFPVYITRYGEEVMDANNPMEFGFDSDVLTRDEAILLFHRVYEYFVEQQGQNKPLMVQER